MKPVQVLTGACTIPMRAEGRCRGGVWTFDAATVPCPSSGLHGYTVRITPYHPDEPKAFLPGLITWADAAGATVAA